MQWIPKNALGDLEWKLKGYFMEEIQTKNAWSWKELWKFLASMPIMKVESTAASAVNLQINNS